MQYALISLILVQTLFVGLSGALYLRQRSKADADKAAMIPWGIKVEAALGTADSAKRQVEMIELEHYKNLRSLFESQALQIGSLKGEIETLKRENEQLSIKVQTLQRMDRHARKKEAEASAPLTPGPSEDPLEVLKQSGDAIPLGPLNGASPHPGPAPRQFGHRY